MRIKTNELDVVFSSLIARKPNEFERKAKWTDGKEDGFAKTGDGKAIYRTDLVALAETKTRGVIMDNSISVAVVEPTEIVPGVQYRAAGEITVSPFIRNGRIAYSITADRLEPVKPTDK